ncbi:MAG: hypothetical protein MUF38_10710 [Anaerolineae bacterium]|nr:hypothetical protein [Anaerolineae bacterium]
MQRTSAYPQQRRNPSPAVFAVTRQPVIQRVVPLPTAQEHTIIQNLTNYLVAFRTALIPAHINRAERRLLAIQNVIDHQPPVGATTLQNYINANNFGLAGVALTNVRNHLINNIFTDANTTFNDIPQRSSHFLPLLTAAWAIVASVRNQTTVSEEAGVNVGHDYANDPVPPTSWGIALGVVPNLNTIINNAAGAQSINHDLNSNATSRLEWVFADGSKIAVDIPGGGNENYQVSYLPHVHLVAGDGTPLSQAGIGVPFSSDPAHILLHWENYNLTQTLVNLSGNQQFKLPTHLQQYGRHP